MTLNDIAELHFITPIKNVPSILKLGILSYDEARRLNAISVADALVQQRRENKQVPNAGRLHSYANLYFHGRNPMMCRIQARRAELAVLRVNPTVLSLRAVIISDGNASSNYTRFYPSPSGLAYLSKELVFARDWRAPNNQILYWHQKRSRCAEVLVPNFIKPEYIVGACVSSEEARKKLKELVSNLVSTVEPDLFTI